MVCGKSDTCDNYFKKCRECWSTSNTLAPTPCYVQKNGSVKFMIFFGNRDSTRADSKLNTWISQNPNVRILEYQYQQARMGDHSICVMYEEN